MSFPSVRTTARSEPRRTARTTAPYSRYSDETKDVEIDLHAAAHADARKRKKATREAQRLTPRYKFHHDKFQPYDVVEFEDNDKYWRVLLTKGSRVNLPKKNIVRVESDTCPADFRTWVDETGRYSTVAKYVQYKKPYAQLETPNERKVTIKETVLSETDRKRLREVIECEEPSE